MKLKYLSYLPTRKHPITLPMLGHRKVRAQEVLEVDATRGAQILEQFPGLFEVVKETPAPKPPPPPAPKEMPAGENKMKVTVDANKEKTNGIERKRSGDSGSGKKPT